MASSLDDFITVAQNIVSAINGLTQTYLSISGAATYENITTATLVKKGPGRIARVAVLVAGTTDGMIYDAAATNLSATRNRVALIDNTVGIYEINMPVASGLVVEPGSGMEVSVSYS